jgi:hypothetical protein
VKTNLPGGIGAREFNSVSTVFSLPRKVGIKEFQKLKKLFRKRTLFEKK